MYYMYTVWTSKDLIKDTKLKVYTTLVPSVLMYNMETWTLTEENKRRLSVFEMTCLRRIEGVNKRDRIRKEEITARVNCTQDVVSNIQQRRLCYFGHIYNFTVISLFWILSTSPSDIK